MLIRLIERILGHRIAVIYNRGKSKYKGSTTNACPFCGVNEDIVFEGTYWTIINNKYPYPRHKSHRLVIPKRHIERWKDLNQEEMEEYMLIKSALLECNRVEMSREYPHAEASVPHLHAHFISHDIE